MAAAPPPPPPGSPAGILPSPRVAPRGSHPGGGGRRPASSARPAPLPIRILSALLPPLAVLLSLTTAYLFHLHHAHHAHLPGGSAAGSDGAVVRVGGASGGGGGGGMEGHGPGGSAMRHKMDLAKFLLRRYDDERAEAGRREAIEGGWRGGDEANFVKMVKEIGEGGDDGGDRAKVKWKGKVKLSRGKNATESDNKEVPKMSWEQLQRALLDGNLLPPPIPPHHVARGFSGLPPDQTPALVGAQRGTITCPGVEPRVNAVMSSMLAFWNEPRGAWDRNHGSTDDPHPFVPPPLGPLEHKEPKKYRRRYLTFEPDTGGWNNLRMSLENILVLAAASGRTLVLPPDQIIYLLEPKKGDPRQRMRNYHDFFNLTENKELLRRVPVITSEEFLKLEGGEDGLVPLGGYNETYREHLLSVSKWCEERKKSTEYCENLYDHFRTHGQLSPLSCEAPDENCVIFDAGVFDHGAEKIQVKIAAIDPEVQARMAKFCGKRSRFYYNRTMHDAPVWHFETMDLRYRLLVHYYAFVFFTDPKVENYYKRFVRDSLRYHDDVFCAAGKVVLALTYEDHVRNGVSRSSTLELDSELMGGYSSLHVRRGDLQFKEVKFDSSKWYQNTKEIWKPSELLYVATDERKKEFFDDFRRQHGGALRFFDDYIDLAGFDDVDATKYGMIDTVIASRGTVFAGTWFSTFSGYIIRLRGYYGVSKFFNYYSWLDRKTFMHKWMDIGEGSLYAREYPTGWTAIDGDAFVGNDLEGEGPRRFPRKVMEQRKAVATKKLIDIRYTGSGNGAKGEVADSAAPMGDDAPLARGVSGRRLEDTPALIGAERGHIACDVDVDSMAYWNEPQGTRDLSFVSPFAHDSPYPKRKYLVFTPDRGGFNNVRMSFEIIFIISAALGRILVLPPEQPMYLLRNDGAKKHRGLNHFFDMDGDDYNNRVKYMTMEQFILTEGRPDGQYPVPPDQMSDLIEASRVCAPGRPVMNWKNEGKPPCDLIHDYIAQHATTPNITATHHQCLVFDKGMYRNGVPDDPESAKQFCSSGKRQMVYVTKKLQEPSLLYIQAAKPPTRMLAHYYGYLHFTDASVGNYYKRYVRDLSHFRHEIFCAAGKIVKFLQNAAKAVGFSPDPDGSGGFSSLHIRRGDFQYKKMKISSESWYDHTKEIWQESEILYIATDEKSHQIFFEPFRRAGHTVYFLSDFKDLAGLDAMDPNWMGMIDVAVASRGRAFAGTFRSTFSGYINRLRGHYGLSMKDSWFGQLKEKRMMHEWHNVNLDTYAKEWPDAWIGIDADVAPSQDVF